MQESTSFAPPPFRVHKPTQQAYVLLDKRRKYLGNANNPATVQVYARLCAELAVGGGELLAGPEQITIEELCAAYWEHALTYYRNPDGTPTSSVDEIRQAFRPLREIYGGLPAKSFGPMALKAVRETHVQRGLSRSTANARTEVIKRAFKWAVENEIISPTVWHGLQAVGGLKRGRCNARETVPVRPVPIEHVYLVKDHVSRQVWAMIQLQLHSGARPGEVIRLRPVDIDTSGTVWTARLKEHKTAYRGRERVLCFGPKCQAILREFMQDRPLHRPIFSPKEAERERHNACEIHRRPNQKPNPRKTERQLRDTYDTNTYRRPIERAIETINEDREEGKKIPNWTPNQLRHNFATVVRRAHGLDAAQVVLGHANANITQVYAEVDNSRAVAIAAELG